MAYGIRWLSLFALLTLPLLLPAPASALVTVELRWSATTHVGVSPPVYPGGDTIAAEAGERLTLDIWIHVDLGGVTYYGISLEFDNDLDDELDFVSFVQTPPPPLSALGAPFFQESSAVQRGYVYGNSAGTVFPTGFTDGSWRLGQVVFEVNDPNFDRHDVEVGFFHLPGSIDLMVDNVGSPIVPSFHSASVAKTTLDQERARFVHRANTDNTALFTTMIDHPFVNDDPEAVLIIEHNYNPGLTGAIYNTHEVGVFYDFVGGRWSIVSLDFGAIPIGSAFNVVVAQPDGLAFVQEASSPNTSGDSTCFNHPETDGDSTPSVFVTANINGGNGADVYNDHPLGIRYDAGAGRVCIYNMDGAAMPVGADFNVKLPLSFDVAHTSSVSNTSGNFTWLASMFWGDDADTILIKSNVLDGATNNPNTMGVFFHVGFQRWAIFNELLSAMPIDARFVWQPDVDQVPYGDKHTVAPENVGHTSRVDHPLMKRQPSQILFKTMHRRPVASGLSPMNPHPMGLYLVPSSLDWALFNQDFATIPVGASYDLFDPADSLRSFHHLTNADNLGSNWTYLRHPHTEGEPNAVVLVEHNFNPDLSTGVYHDHTLGVFYNASLQDWAIFNQDLTAMTPGTTFNVYVADPSSEVVLVHTATVGNTIGSETTIDHPDLNNTAYFSMVLTQNYNPGGVGATYNNHEVGLRFDVQAGRWVVFNQDGAVMPVGASFNIVTLPEPGAAPMLAAGVLALARLACRRRAALSTGRCCMNQKCTNVARPQCRASGSRRRSLVNTSRSITRIEQYRHRWPSRAWSCQSSAIGG